jgi:fatty-acyl-CoA synthase
MIIRSGFNIYPREVEDVLSTHVDVAMVAVLGVPDAKWGEAVTAVIVPCVGAKPAPAELIDLVKRLKRPAHPPKHVQFVDALPMTSVGKIDKRLSRRNSGPANGGWSARPTTPMGLVGRHIDLSRGR